jgi:glucose-1-phosphate thymidylyltransferase
MSRVESPLLGVILAAGKGTRLQPFSERYPKPILPILGKPLLQHQVECLREVGVRRVIIVIGHLGFEIVRALGDGRDLGVEIDFVDQGSTLGIAHALSKLEPVIDRPFMLFLGDIFFLHDDLRRMVTMLGPDEVHGVLAVKDEPSVEAVRRNFVVLEDDAGFVRRVIEKPQYPPSRLKGCGLYLFDPMFFDAVRRTPRTAMRDEYEITDAIQIFVDDGHRVRAARVIRDDLNLSYPADLLDINLKLLGDGTRNHIGKGVRLAPGCSVEHSVIMDGAIVTHPIAIRDTLIFPEVTVSAASDLRRTIVTAEHVIECR